MDHSPTSQMELRLAPSSEVINQQVGPKRMPPSTRPTLKASYGHKRNYCEEEIHPCPARYEQPYGKWEGVAISQSRLPVAGRGLFGIKPSKHNSLLLKKAHEFACVCATMQDIISMEEAQISDSAYVKTNSKNLQLEWDSVALYFDAIHNRHYGKMVNDSWSVDGSNFMIKCNPLLRRVEV
jgi:hypothetical protein